MQKQTGLTVPQRAKATMPKRLWTKIMATCLFLTSNWPRSLLRSRISLCKRKIPRQPSS